jgi:hypothetical protein
MQSRYAAIQQEDFAEEQPRALPGELNIIDENLLNPRIFDGGMKFPGLNRQLQIVKQSLHQRERQQKQHDWLNINKKTRYFVDLTLPLLQLFFMTLFPWVNVHPNRL